MNYTIKVGNSTLHDLSLNDKTRVVLSPLLTQEAGRVDSLSFSIPKSNAAYSAIQPRTSWAELRRDQTLLGRFRLIDESRDWYESRTCLLEGELGCLSDTIVRPMTYTGTVSGALQALITQHNAQSPAVSFSLGNVTVSTTDDVELDLSDYPTTWEAIQNELVSVLGGYILLRYNSTGTTRYIDYLATPTETAAQGITLTGNLLDHKRAINTADIATAVIPLGAKGEDGKRITIGTTDIIRDSDAIDLYGLSIKTVVFDDVTSPTTLLRRGQAYLDDSVKRAETYDIKAADLSEQPFKIFTNVTVTDSFHGSGTYMIDRLQLALDGTVNTITVGKEPPRITNPSFAKKTAQKLVDQAVGGIVDEANAYTDTHIFAVEQARQNMNLLAANTLGYFYTEEVEDGRTIGYWHDRPRLDDSTIIYMMGADGFFLSRDGGETWTEGFDGTTGNAVLNILSAIGIQAEWVDVDGMVTRINQDSTKAIDAGRVTVGGQGLSAKFQTIENNIQQTSSSLTQTSSSLESEIRARASADSGLSERITRVSQTADGIQIDLASTQEDLDGFLTEFNTFFQFLTEGLKISKSGSDFATLLSDTKLSFMQGGTEVAYLQYNRLNISEAYIGQLGIQGPGTTDDAYIYIDANGTMICQRRSK